MISVIIPTYNDTKKLKQALESVISQTYKDIEIIVVGDGLDQKLPLLGEEELAKVRFFTIKHGGAPKARNYGFGKSKGEYVIFWDADIIGRRDMLEVMLKELSDSPDASYAYSSYWWGRKGFEQWEFDPDKLREINYIHTTSLIRRERFPGFDESIKRFQDWDLWLAMLENGHVGVFIPDYLFRVQTGGTMSSWLPKCAYRAPFKYFLFGKARKNLADYERAVEIIRKKHNLPKPKT